MNSEALSVPEKFANAKPIRSNTVVPVVVKPYVGNLAKSFRLRVCGATQHGCCWKPFSMLFLQSKFDCSVQQQNWMNWRATIFLNQTIGNPYRSLSGQIFMSKNCGRNTTLFPQLHRYSAFFYG
jgi:epoxyqueuosine reductase QueG